MVVTFLGIAAYPAYADPPVILKQQWVSGPDPLADCGDFDALFSQDIAVQVQLFFNKDGDLVREHNIFTRGSIMYTNSVTGDSITGRGPGINIWNYESLTVAAVGVFFMGRIGNDEVLFDVGRIVVDLTTFTMTFAAGPKGVVGSDVGSGFGFDPLCEFLA